MPTGFRVLMTVPVVFVVLLVAALVTGVRALRTEPVGVAARAHLAVVAVGLAGLTWFLLHWNLVGWRFG